MDFWGPFSGGAKMAFFGLRNALSGIPGFRVLYGASTIAIIGVPESEFLERAFGAPSSHPFALSLPPFSPFQALSPLLSLLPSSPPLFASFVSC